MKLMHVPFWVVSAIVLLATLLVGCGDRNAVTSASQAHPVRIVLDQNVVAEVHARDLKTRTSIRSFLPKAASAPRAWKTFLAISRDGSRRFGVSDIASKYTQHDLSLYVDGESRLCMGVFRHVPANAKPAVRQYLAQPHIAIVDVAEIRIRTTPAPKPMGKPLIVYVDGKEHQVAAETLDSLATIRIDRARDTSKKRGKRGKKQVGWRLLDALLHLGVSAGDIESVSVQCGEASGATNNERVPIATPENAAIRRNRRGEFQVILSASADAETASPGEATPKQAPGRIRGVTSLRVSLKAHAR